MEEVWKVCPYGQYDVDSVFPLIGISFLLCSSKTPVAFFHSPYYVFHWFFFPSASNPHFIFCQENFKPLIAESDFHTHSI